MIHPSLFCGLNANGMAAAIRFKVDSFTWPTLGINCADDVCTIVSGWILVGRVP